MTDERKALMLPLGILVGSGRRLRNEILSGIVIGCLVVGCATSPADQAAATKAWAERDAERQRECATRNGKWVAGACLFGSGA